MKTLKTELKNLKKWEGGAAAMVWRRDAVYCLRVPKMQLRNCTPSRKNSPFGRAHHIFVLPSQLGAPQKVEGDTKKFSISAPPLSTCFWCHFALSPYNIYLFFNTGRIVPYHQLCEVASYHR